MDTRYVCPDCHSVHTEPEEPVLGTVARCFTCEVDARLDRVAAALLDGPMERPAIRTAA